MAPESAAADRPRRRLTDRIGIAPHAAAFHADARQRAPGNATWRLIQVIAWSHARR
jgi:hypothetical protein